MAKYYLCGPFWDADCKRFFDDFIEKTRLSIMTSSGDSKYAGIEVGTVSNDLLFIPGNYNVDFDDIKKTWSPNNMRRVLKQVLDLDLEYLKEDTGLVMYAKVPDLGSLFELGYFLAGETYYEYNYSNYNQLRKKLIIEGGYEKLYNSIDKLMSSYFIQSYVPTLVSPQPLVIDGYNSVNFGKLNFEKFNIAVIRTDNFKDEPFNAMLAGYLYRNDIPFITYSSSDTRSNTMMLAASLGHMRLRSNKIEKVKRSAIDYLNKIKENFWSDENINCSKGID